MKRLTKENVLYGDAAGGIQRIFSRNVILRRILSRLLHLERFLFLIAMYVLQSTSLSRRTADRYYAILDNLFD